MTSQAAVSFSGNMKKALAGLRRINLEGLRWRVFDAKGQDRDRKLRIFAESEHPFGDRPLEPYITPHRRVREMRPRARRAMIRAQKKAELQQQSGNETRKGKRKEVNADLSS
ncbi:hypothetical protein F2P56_021472 [Juglans regia]|uniref:Uncharacterized protein n=1 Tax=Juglans regia TaxID=51240 RepID=A0A833U5V4_JUGRE|nr:hypothetical protein F2P56_021472 [Juglans regia]